MPITIYDNSGKPFSVNSTQEAKEIIGAGEAGFAKNQNVLMKDLEGKPVSVKGEFANSYLLDKGYDLTSAEELNAQTAREPYETATQKAVTTAESVINQSLVGFGKAAEIQAARILRGDEYANKLREDIAKREEINPTASFLGDVIGIAIDPVGLVGQTAKLGKYTGGAFKPLGKVAQRAVQFGIDGATFAGLNETGKQLRDDYHLNSDAILDQMKFGGVFGAGLGAGVGAIESAASSTLNLAKKIAKKNVDKITGATEEQAGETFKATNREALTPSKENPIDNEKPAITLKKKTSVDGQADTGDWHYDDGKRSGVVPIDESANILDLTTQESLNKTGEKLKINDFDKKINLKQDSPFKDFVSEEVFNQKITNNLDSKRPYMSDAIGRLYDSIRFQESEILNLKNPTNAEIEQYKNLQRMKQNIFKAQNEPLFEALKNYPDEWESIINKGKRDAENLLKDNHAVKELSNGQEVLHILDKEILPEEITLKLNNKGITPLTFEAKEMVGQLGVNSSKLRKLGNQRINEVMDFILDHYPKEGSFFKKGTTSIDYIQEKINESMNKSLNELNEVVSEALNHPKGSQRLSYEDMARYVEDQILSKYIDPVSGNPKAGQTTQFNQVKSFADELRSNGYALDKYGKKVYKKLNAEEMRQFRINLDKETINYNKIPGQYSATEDAASNLRNWIEDQVISSVQDVKPELKQKYINAKKVYQNSKDAQAIVTGAINKALTKSGFDLKYSIATGALASLTGNAPLAIASSIGVGYGKGLLKDYTGSLSVFLTRSMGEGVYGYSEKINKAVNGFFRTYDTALSIVNKVPKQNHEEIVKKDFEKLQGEISDPEKFRQDFIDNNDFLFSYYPKTSMNIMNSIEKTRMFLLEKLPKNPFAGNPVKEDLWKPSAYELAKYMRYREAAEKPSVILEQFKNGYVSSEATEVLNTLYPETKNEMAKAILSNPEKIKKLPIEKRHELFKVFGIKLDSFNNPQTFLDLQNKANAQANASKMENMGQMRPNNAFKIKDKDLSLGNRTLKD